MRRGTTRALVNTMTRLHLVRAKEREIAEAVSKLGDAEKNVGKTSKMVSRPYNGRVPR